MKKQVLYSLLFKALRFLLGALFGVAVTLGYITSGQATYVAEAVATFLLWAISAFFSAVLHQLKIIEARRTDPEAQVTFAEIRAAARAALFDLISNYVRKSNSQEGTQ